METSKGNRAYEESNRFGNQLTGSVARPRSGMVKAKLLET
jgi:hypothetical protein